MTENTHEEILRARKGKWVLVLMVCVAFVVAGWMVRLRSGELDAAWWSYGGIAFFGLGALVSILQLVPGSSFLRITPEGITVRTVWRARFFRWSDIERFGVAEVSGGMPGTRVVGLDFSASSPWADKMPRLKDLSRKLSGFDGALPDNYGWEHAKLAAHLNELRAKYLGSGPS
jgi:hypothetical protein